MSIDMRDEIEINIKHKESVARLRKDEKDISEKAHDFLRKNEGIAYTPKEIASEIGLSHEAAGHAVVEIVCRSGLGRYDRGNGFSCIEIKNEVHFLYDRNNI